jgi:hypothetical protein
MRYPASYGFIPQTLSDDGDPLDILVYNTVPILTGTLVECRIVGGLLTVDNGVPDYKVLGIPLYNPNEYNDITDLDEIFLDVGKQNLSSYDEIEMIRERLLQLETIQFHGVLKIPYLLSPSSADEGKTTSSGGGLVDDLDKLNKQIEEKKAEKQSLLDKI